MRIIRSRDIEDTFFYLDSPYVGTFMGHYDGYSQQDFDNLLSELSKIKGKFLLSSFRNESLNKFADEFGWFQVELKMQKSMNAHAGKNMTKIEVLTSNYEIGVVNGTVKLLEDDRRGFLPFDV